MVQEWLMIMAEKQQTGHHHKDMAKAPLNVSRLVSSGEYVLISAIHGMNDLQKLIKLKVINNDGSLLD